MKGFNQLERCLLCNSDWLLPLKGYHDHYLVKCSNCQFVFCKRKPESEELLNHYQHYPRANTISPITIKRYDQLLDTFEKFRKNNKIIDVGCGDGYFLEVARMRNWDVYGTEFTHEAVRICELKGIQMCLGSLHPENYEKDFFDIITSFEVIEHINEPRREVEAFDRILRRGGIVYVTTPNFNSISRNLMGSHWNIIEYPEHLSYYTPRTLKKLFLDNHFKLVSLTASGISFNRLKQKMPLTASAVNTDENLRERIETNFVLGTLKGVVNSLLNFFGKGDGLKAYFQKL